MKEILFGEKIRNIHLLSDAEAFDDIFIFKKIIIETTQLIVIEPVIETDEILVSIEKLSYLRTVNASKLESYNSRKLTGFWQCKNEQGYVDQIILGFDVLRPTISFLCECGYLGVYTNMHMDKRMLKISE